MKKLINILFVLIIIITGCKTKKTGEDEVQKLLDRQAQVKDSQEETVDKLTRIKDSLAIEKELLVAARDQTNEKVKLLTKHRKVLVDELKEGEESELTAEKSRLNEQISIYEDSIELMKRESAFIETEIDSIEESMGFYDLQEGQARKILESGIEEIDQKMTKLENQKQQERKKISLLEKRITISERKIETYKMERQMYVDERDELLRINASDEQIKPYLKRISEIDSIIEAEENNKFALSGNLSESREWVSGVDTMIDNLQTRIKQEYDKREIIESFIDSEKKRLQNEITDLQSTRKGLITEQELISEELSGMEQKITSLDKRMELIKNKDMSSILEQRAEIEESEAALAEEEIQLLDESSKLDTYSFVTTSESTDVELKNLVELSNQLDSLRRSIEEEKTEIAKTRKELSEKRAEVAKKRASFGRTITTILVIVIIGGLALLSLFYYLGKRSRKS
jgi:chromosome segregation ATPase